MIDNVKKTECYLCGNCQKICPAGAISFVEEYRTFKYPHIDFSACIKCNRCEQFCPSIQNAPELGSLKLSYQAKHKDREILKRSSSGGVFLALAQTVLDESGFVCGAVFNEGWNVKHLIASDKETCRLFCGSKYTQSDLGDCFQEIKRILEDNKTVLFSGCPCQCAALHLWLGKKYDTLIIVDFICHGTLSAQLFREYLDWLRDKAHSEIRKFQFRDKERGWVDSGPRIEFANGKVLSWPLYEDIYMQGYFQNLCMRESCYHCKFKDFKSGSDITLGDFWGAENKSPEFFDSDGVSLVIANTEKGEKLVTQARTELIMERQDLSVLAMYNQGLFMPFRKGEKSEELHKLAAKLGYIPALETFSKLSARQKARRMISRFLRKIRRKTKKIGV